MFADDKMSRSGNDAISERRLRPIYDWLDNGNNKKALQEAEKVTVYYSIGFTKSKLKFWRQICKSGDGALLISRQI